MLYQGILLSPLSDTQFIIKLNAPNMGFTLVSGSGFGYMCKCLATAYAVTQTLYLGMIRLVFYLCAAASG